MAITALQCTCRQKVIYRTGNGSLKALTGSAKLKMDCKNQGIKQMTTK